jgi:CDP-paratose 2-epimerase
MAYLVTGGCGFVGSNLVAQLIRLGETVIVLDNLSRQTTLDNLAWLRQLGEFKFFHGDVRNSHDLELVFRKHDIECVFHLAGQVAMTTSLENPRYDFETNVLGSINVLECVRLFSPAATVVYASSNKVYGELRELPLVETATRYEPAGKKDIDEGARLHFCTPYGCSKGAADQYMQEYARSFGLNTVVFRHSTIYGGRQVSTFDQGWVGWFCEKALEARERPDASFTINGDGKQVRDLLHVSDAVACYLAAHEHRSEARGHVMNIGGGYDNSLSLRELFMLLDEQLGVKLNPRQLPWRANDQKYFVADNSKATRYLHWVPRIGKTAGVADTIEWERSRKNILG